jgi:hypothetical protein
MHVADTFSLEATSVAVDAFNNFRAFPEIAFGGISARPDL